MVLLEIAEKESEGTFLTFNAFNFSEILVRSYQKCYSLGCTLSTRLSENQLSEITLPCILHWNQNHFVVLYKIDRNGQRFHISDPAKGRYKLNREEFANHWLSTQLG